MCSIMQKRRWFIVGLGGFGEEAGVDKKDRKKKAQKQKRRQQKKGTGETGKKA